MIKKLRHIQLLLTFYCISLHSDCCAQGVQIVHDSKEKKVIFGNEKIQLTLDYNHKASITSMLVNGQQVIANDSGMYAAISTKHAVYSTLRLQSTPVVAITGNSIRVSQIIYGDKKHRIRESWSFNITAKDIRFGIRRTLSAPLIAAQVALPVFMFKDTATWEGAYQDYGGLAWFYLFKKMDTYGVHSSTSRFWNSKTNNGLSIAVVAPGRQVAMDYSRTADNRISCAVTIAPEKITPRFDSGTYRRRFIRDSTAVWAPVVLPAGASSQDITLGWFDFNGEYGRGKLVGINQEQVNAVLNTIARIGVIDQQHFGGNSWHTPYGPICLHEQYIAQMGLAINDPAYLKGYRECLDFYRDNAITPAGRVWPRWAYSNEDAMPGKFTSKGFYEAQWGYLLDANPDFVTNVAELYDQNGDLAWVKTQQAACEKALDWIIHRDSNNNGLVEMITDSTGQKRGSDWIDIIWAAYENAFVNAKLYYALTLWEAIEKQLGNSIKASYYRQFAEKLKLNFNKRTAAGGFWNEEKKCYIHWRDKDGSIHGSNMVTPVNFMAIAYGICEDTARTKMILDSIEVQMQRENLFFWPLCMYSYGPGEGNDWQFPFPNYENGDIFLSWGSVAVKAYAAYKPELAVKYVKNVLAQYAKDGLAFQRYGRLKQEGLGDDILSGNSLSVVGLYQSVYGIHPLYNRLYLEPHITKELAGTQVRYHYRGQQLLIELNMDRYAVSGNRFKITAARPFGFFAKDNKLTYFNGNRQNASLEVKTAGTGRLTIHVSKWESGQMNWTQSFNNTKVSRLTYQVNDCTPGSFYSILVNGKLLARVKSDLTGRLVFDAPPGKNSADILLLKQ